MVGEVIAGRYELEELVGTGGHSSVYRAHDTLLERRVAIKLLHEQLGADPDLVERFRREARAVAQLAHPNIVTVIDRGERDGRQFIVFEFVEGENLKQLVSREGPLPLRRAVRLGLQVADALAFAHRHGLVHRDVKPQNVLIGRSGDAKVTDFGIAHDLDVHGLTQTGSMLGTSGYIAPEQARGEAVDQRTDVYALGAVLYELVSGEQPFPGDNAVAVALRHLNEAPPSVRLRRPDAPAQLDAALRRAMAKDPSERFGTMDQLAAELETCLVELPSGEEDVTTVVPRGAVTARPTAPSAPRSRVWPALLGALAILAAGVAGAFALGIVDRGGGGSTEAATTETRETRPLRAVPLNAVGSWDPDGDNGSENDAAVGNAVDGEETTFWSTEGYDSTLEDLGKSGVGIVLDAGGRTVARVRVRSDTPGFTAVLKAGPEADGPFGVVSRSVQVGADMTFALDPPARRRYLLVWITRLAQPDRYRAHLNEVTAQG